MSELSALRRDPEFRRGASEMLPASLGLAAWGLVTGVAMVKSGLGVPLSLLMSLTVFAGSSQLAALPLIAAGAPVWVVWLTGFCVNLRFVIFSAQWRPYFKHLPRRIRIALAYLATDLNIVVFTRRFPDGRVEAGQVPYFLGGAVANWFAWQLPSVAGIALADQIPSQWGLGFAGVLALLGIAYSLLSDRSSSMAAVVAAGAAVAAFALPYKLNIVVAIAAAVAAGVVMDRAAASAGGAARQPAERHS